jgi:hypothetical protein
LSKEAVVKQFFMDFIENLGENIDEYEEYDQEECNQILANMFFASNLEIKWNSKTERLMLKPTFVLDIKRGDKKYESLVRVLGKHR